MLSSLNHLVLFQAIIRIPITSPNTNMCKIIWLEDDPFPFEMALFLGDLCFFSGGRINQ